MPKDTTSLGNNKASAWESRGFVIKKEGMHFDTPSKVYSNLISETPTNLLGLVCIVMRTAST